MGSGEYGEGIWLLEDSGTVCGWEAKINDGGTVCETGSRRKSKHWGSGEKDVEVGSNESGMWKDVFILHKTWHCEK